MGYEWQHGQRTVGDPTIFRNEEEKARMATWLEAEEKTLPLYKDLLLAEGKPLPPLLKELQIFIISILKQVRGISFLIQASHVPESHRKLVFRVEELKGLISALLSQHGREVRDELLREEPLYLKPEDFKVDTLLTGLQQALEGNSLANWVSNMDVLPKQVLDIGVLTPMGQPDLSLRAAYSDTSQQSDHLKVQPSSQYGRLLSNGGSNDKMVSLKGELPPGWHVDKPRSLKSDRDFGETFRNNFLHLYIPRFSGKNGMTFTKLWALFRTHVHCLAEDQVTQSEKLCFLLKVMEKDSDPWETVNNYIHSHEPEKAYEECMRELYSTYVRKTDSEKEQACKALKDLEPMSDESGDQERFARKVFHQHSDLVHGGYTQEDAAKKIIKYLQKKLERRFLSDLYVKLNIEDELDWFKSDPLEAMQSMKIALSKVFRRFEHQESQKSLVGASMAGKYNKFRNPEKPDKGQPNQESKYKRKRRDSKKDLKALVEVATSSMPGGCECCGQPDHRIQNCPLPVAERKRILMKKKTCTNCFSPNCPIPCPKPPGCNTCIGKGKGGRHSPWVCFDLEKQLNPHPRPGPSGKQGSTDEDPPQSQGRGEWRPRGSYRGNRGGFRGGSFDRGSFRGNSRGSWRGGRESSFRGSDSWRGSRGRGAWRGNDRRGYGYQERNQGNRNFDNNSGGAGQDDRSQYDQRQNGSNPSGLAQLIALGLESLTRNTGNCGPTAQVPVPAPAQQPGLGNG